MSLKYKLPSVSVVILSLVLIAGGKPALAEKFSNPALNSGTGSNSSFNWAGYVADTGSYSSVTGTWNVPSVTNNNSFSADASWIGLGGVKSGDLIQTGTQAINSGSSITYQAWYEMLPGNSQTISITVNPGDSITATINEQSLNEWAVSLRDNTNGQNFQTVVPYTSSMSSAEWIEEMPSQSSGQFIPLDNFGNVNFSNATAVENGSDMTLSQLDAQPLIMVNSQGQDLAVPSGLGADGMSFEVSRDSATPSTSLGAAPGGRRGFGRSGVGVRGFSATHRNFHASGGTNSGFTQVFRGQGFSFSFRFSRSK